MFRIPSLSRRDWLAGAAVGLGGASLSGWLSGMARGAAANPARKKSVILLWMDGGPATIDLWDLKPGHKNGGPFKEIATAAPGVKISEHLPKLARWTKQMAIVRSMTTKEGDHNRATHLVRTGYVPQGAIQYPALGALVAHQKGTTDADLPSFVSVAPSRFQTTLGAGFLGPNYAPLVISEPGSTAGLEVPNLARPAGVSDALFDDRLLLLGGLDRSFTAGRSDVVVDSLRAAGGRAVRLMSAEAARSFRLEEESARTRDAYGRSLFGQGCLLARRLVERGVSFVEVTLGGWDTHSNNFEQVRGLAGSVDTAWSALMEDLKGRGLLDSTLIVWMGEFGRTPQINGNTGRDHWPASWSAVLAGGGISGGQAVGKTSAGGTAVEDRPVKLPDLLATIYKAIGIDHTKQNLSNVNRPIRLAEVSAKPIEGV